MSSTADTGAAGLVRRLRDGEALARIADEWLDHHDWMRTAPPPTLIAGLLDPDGPTDGPVVDLVRVWDRDLMTAALLAAVDGEPDPAQRVRAAWLAKVHPSPRAAEALLAGAARSDDDPTIRSFLLEAVDRLVAGGHLHWADIADTLLTLSRDPESVVRDAVVGVLMSTGGADEAANRLLVGMLSDTDPTVLASVINALAHTADLNLDPALAARLMAHPDPRVSRPAGRYLRRGGLSDSE